MLFVERLLLFISVAPTVHSQTTLFWKTATKNYTRIQPNSTTVTPSNATVWKTTPTPYHWGTQPITTTVTSTTQPVVDPDASTCQKPIYSTFSRSSGNADTTLTCLLDTAPSLNCQYWRVAVLLLLNNTWYSKLYLQQIQNFINEVTADCDKSSTLLVFDPGRSTINDNCPAAQIGTQKNLIKGISLDDTISKGTLSAGDQLDMLLEQLHKCITANPLATAEAGVVFVFTDLTCLDLCQSAKLRTDAQSITDGLVNQQRFVMRYMFLSDSNSETECAENLFATCHRMSPSLCDVGVYGNQTMQLSGCADISTTCHATNHQNGPEFTTLDLVISIAVPSLCITVICTVCAAYCYKKSKYSTRRLMKFWQSQSEHSQRTKTMASHFQPQHQQTELPHPASIVMANHYTDIKALVNANRKDLWEVNQANLYINENEVLGNGAFAIVLKGTLKGKIPLLQANPRLNIFSEHVQEEGACEAAVKRLPSHANDQNRMDFFQEINFMKNLGYHAHVISMLGCVSCPTNPMILVEYCEYGDLLRFLRNHRANVIMSDEDLCPINAKMILRVKDLVSISWQASDGMAYLSSKNFIHRDVAARNVLLTKQLVAKISDFGLGRYADSALYTARGGRLPFKSMAIEALKFYEFSEKTDVWAFGILLYEIFSLGDVPYNTVQPTDMMAHLEQGNRPPQPEKCPNEIYALMARCWKANPDDRPTFAEIRGELAILLNIDDESYGYLSLDTRQLRNMFNRQITERHSAQVENAETHQTLAVNDSLYENSSSQKQSEMEPAEMRSSETGKSDDNTATSNTQQQRGNDSCLDSPPVTFEAGSSTSTTDYTKKLPQSAVQEFSYASSTKSSTDIYARFSKLDSLLPPGSTECEKDVNSFIDNSVNFFCQIPEEKRGDYLISIEEWMQEKLSEGGLER